MIEVKVCRDSAKGIFGFQISGHADYAKTGDDIVCAAVSVLAENTVNSIETFTKDPVDVEAVNEEAGFLCFRLASVSAESRLLLDSFVLGIRSIAEDHERNVKLLEVMED